VDRLHHPSAEPGQTGQWSTGVSGFFSMAKAHLPNYRKLKAFNGQPKIKNPVQLGFWTGFYIFRCLSFLADPNHNLRLTFKKQKFYAGSGIGIISQRTPNLRQ